MACSHDSYRSFSSSYDLSREVLVYFWHCDECGARLDEAARVDYRPSFNPHGNDEFRIDTAA